MGILVAIIGAAIIGFMAGLQAFLPLLIASALAIKGVIVLAPGFGWIGTWAAFVIFLILTLIEHVISSISIVDTTVASCQKYASSPVIGVVLALAMLDASGCGAFLLAAIGLVTTLTTVSARIPARIAALAAGPLGALGITAAEDVLIFILTGVLLFVMM